MRRFQCLGKTKSGKRCQNKFLTSIYSEDITCNLHRNQEATFQYGDINIGGFKDVAKLIAEYINSPKTFLAFASVCRSTAKACHELQKQKKKEFTIVKKLDSGFEYRVLPNGSLVK